MYHHIEDIVDHLRNSEEGSENYQYAKWELERLFKIKELSFKLENYLRLKYNISYQIDWPAPILREFSEKLKEL